ncbi:hypothetical protein LguiB_020658 [Lonicera macranthoides]
MLESVFTSFVSLKEQITNGQHFRALLQYSTTLDNMIAKHWIPLFNGANRRPIGAWWFSIEHLDSRGSSDNALERSWLKVSRMLLGGMKVVGIYMWVNESSFKNSTMISCQLVGIDLQGHRCSCGILGSTWAHSGHPAQQEEEKEGNELKQKMKRKLVKGCTAGPLHRATKEELERPLPKLEQKNQDQIIEQLRKAKGAMEIQRDYFAKETVKLHEKIFRLEKVVFKQKNQLEEMGYISDTDQPGPYLRIEPTSPTPSSYSSSQEPMSDFESVSTNSADPEYLSQGANNNPKPTPENFTNPVLRLSPALTGLRTV